jgi:hypothetical protein
MEQVAKESRNISIPSQAANRNRANFRKLRDEKKINPVKQRAKITT